MKIIIIVLLSLIALVPTVFAETSSVNLLKAGSFEYNSCDGTYVHVVSDKVKVYYVEGVSATLNEYNAAVEAYVAPKTLDERLTDLESKVTTLETSAVSKESA